MARQIPIMYGLVICSTIALAATFVDVAPPLLSLQIPAVLCLLCVIRLVTWLRMRGRVVGHGEAVRRLRGVTQIVLPMGIAFAAWALSLYPYGDAFQQSHVAFFMAITLLGCIFCLMQLPEAALILTVVMMVPFLWYFAASGRPAFGAIAVNTVLVASAMIAVMFSYFRDFANLTESKKQLVLKQAETQRLSDANFRLANLDSLTGLPNRRRFFADLDAIFLRAQAEKTRFAVALVDLDGFKPINDVFGHIVGDRVLIEVGQRLRRICEPSVTVARLGGDEFGLLIDGDRTDAELQALGLAVCEALQAPCLVHGVGVQISASAGFASFPEAGASASQLFERADYALYYAKQNHRGATAVFSCRLKHELRDLGLIEQGLRNANLDAELSLAFQPIVNIDTGRPIGFEALARWNSPQLGEVAPSSFIKVAERSDLITKLTEVLLRKALETARSWPDDVRISFNLSTRDIVSSDAILRIMRIIAKSGIDPCRVDLEVTETAVMHDFDQACDGLRVLRQLGLAIALDDFGTGFSSLSYVHKLPLDKIKIDRSFIAELETDGTCRDIVKSVVDLCRNLKLDCVVEGVETEPQLAILSELGCRSIQGYLFGKPMSAAEVQTYLGIDQTAPADTRLFA